MSKNLVKVVITEGQCPVCKNWHPVDSVGMTAPHHGRALFGRRRNLELCPGGQPKNCRAVEQARVLPERFNGSQ